MDYSELVDRRYSCRAYTDDAVSDAEVERILSAGLASPSARNLQPTTVIAVRSPQGLRVIDEACNRYNAPLALVVCTDMSESWERPYDGKRMGEVDAAIATTQMMYAAEEIGLGSLWIGMFDPEKISNGFRLDEGITPVSILAVGHRADSTSRNHGIRKEMKDFARFA